MLSRIFRWLFVVVVHEFAGFVADRIVAVFGVA
jgi:hypothetical protein